jgi:PPIC-type PPIASE domain
VTLPPSSPGRSPGSAFRRLLREPLLHFLVLGAALFGVYRLASTRSSDDRIVVSAGKVRSLAETFRLTWQRPPTDAELQGLVADHVREEVLVRQARRLGLEQDDTIVRRRLRTRMDIFFDDTAAIAPPTDAQLQAYLEAHSDAFRKESRTSFLQVYLSPERHGERMEGDLHRMKAALDHPRPGTDVAALGDPSMLDTRFDASSEREVVRVFGEEFARGLASAPLDRWSGPLRSGYGAHFVRVTERAPGRPAKLEEVREAVQREWLSQETTRAREAAYQALLRKYQVTVKPSAVETVSPRAGR